jgi:hypothetical protein
MKFFDDLIDDDGEEGDAALPDLRDGLSPGVPGVGGHCHFAGRCFPFRLDGPWMTMPGVDVHSAGQATHQ